MKDDKTVRQSFTALSDDSKNSDNDEDVANAVEEVIVHFSQVDYNSNDLFLGRDPRKC